jgi:hypothetical protein
VHAAKPLWQERSHKEEWSFLLVDASNAFNEGNRMLTPWTVRHEWPSDARHVFNCCRHFAIFFGDPQWQQGPVATTTHSL